MKMRTYKIHWQAYLVAGSPKINPGKGDGNKVRCEGVSNIKARDAGDAKIMYKSMFPNDKVIRVE